MKLRAATTAFLLLAALLLAGGHHHDLTVPQNPQLQSRNASGQALCSLCEHRSQIAIPENSETTAIACVTVLVTLRSEPPVLSQPPSPRSERAPPAV